MLYNINTDNSDNILLALADINQGQIIERSAKEVMTEFLFQRLLKL